MGLQNVIMKLVFRRAFHGMVNNNTENSKCIEFTLYVLSFSMEIKKPVHQVQVASHTSVFFLPVME